MGKIQNQLNQLMMSMLGGGIAYQHSPYVSGQKAIKKAGETITSLQEVVAGSEASPQATQLELMPDITKAYEDYENAIIRYGTKEQKQALYQNYETEGGYQGGPNSDLPYLKYEAFWPGAGALREAYLEAGGKNVGYWGDDTIKEIRRAMDAKQGIKDAVGERRMTIKEFLFGEPKPLGPNETPDRSGETANSRVKNPGSRRVDPGVDYQNPGYKPFVKPETVVYKPETVVHKGKTVPETPDTDIETETIKYSKPGSRLYKG